jgi:hypothetical protein
MSNKERFGKKQGADIVTSFCALTNRSRPARRQVNKLKGTS